MHPREVAIVGALVIALLVPWLCVRDVLAHPKTAWAAARRRRWVWVLVVVAVPVLGPAWYLRVVRPQVRAQVRPARPRSRA